MNLKVLFYKKSEQLVTPADYAEWALSMLENDFSSESLYILSSLHEPLNLFEVEDYFDRTFVELNLTIPSPEECARAYIEMLCQEIVSGGSDPFPIIDDIYLVVREYALQELTVWYDISEQINDFRYGDNYRNTTKEALLALIKKEAMKQLET